MADSGLRKAALKARDGDEQALNELCCMCMPRLKALFYHLGAGMDADDMTHDTLLRVITRIRTFRSMPGSSFEGWLYRIAYNVFIDSRRKRAVKPPIVNDALLPGADEKVIRSERDTRLYKAIDTLDDEQRALILLRYFCDMSYIDIARTLGITPTRVKWRLHNALRALEKELKEDRQWMI